MTSAHGLLSWPRMPANVACAWYNFILVIMLYVLVYASADSGFTTMHPANSCCAYKATVPSVFTIMLHYQATMESPLTITVFNMIIYYILFAIMKMLNIPINNGI